jgi:hypothetical protein
MKGGKTKFNVSTCIFTSTTIRKLIAPKLAIKKILKGKKFKPP